MTSSLTFLLSVSNEITAGNTRISLICFRTMGGRILWNDLQHALLADSFSKGSIGRQALEVLEALKMGRFLFSVEKLSTCNRMVVVSTGYGGTREESEGWRSLFKSSATSIV